MVNMSMKKDTNNTNLKFSEETIMNLVDSFENKFCHKDCKTLIYNLCKRKISFKKDEITQIYLELVDAVEKGKLIYDEINKCPVQILTSPVYYNGQVINILSYKPGVEYTRGFNIKNKSSFEQSLAYISLLTNVDIDAIRLFQEEDNLIGVNLISLYYML